ncbi:MAG: DNA-3-methyladenine glycosylase 2 family protein [Geodermatophilaceae bacterium]|nr:DNA-3-methyladenine glycosylase 2 family protein [Geodermatophilaceae bacterium]
MDVLRTLGSLRRGAGDPTYRVDPGGALWRTTTTPDGPATLRLSRRDGVIRSQAWGAGAEWALARVPDSLGARDDWTGLQPPRGRLTDTWRRNPGLRIPRTGRVWDVLLAAVLEQKVTGTEAHRSWRQLAAVAGTAAPGPAPSGMRVPPTPSALLRVPDWTWHGCGVDGPRRRALRAAATVADRMEEAVDLPREPALARLRVIPGVGPWTAAEVAQRAFGDGDTVSVGDYHLASFVGWALVGHALDDEGMLAVLAPYRPHRYRLVRLLEVSGFSKPRFGPRMSVRDYRAV